MKKPDEIKKGLRCLSHDRTHTLPCSDCEYHGQGLPPCRSAVHEDALALIQQLEDDIDMMCDKLTEMHESLPRWISVDERLPEDGKNVLVHVTNPAVWWNVDVDWRTEGGWAVNADSDWHIVTHWMPLPEPPKEEST